MNQTTINSTIPITSEFDCQPEPYLLVERMVLGVFFGVIISVVSFFFNSFLFIMFASNKQHRKTPNLFMLLLSFYDIFISITYIALMSLRIIILWTYNFTLHTLWSYYMVPMLTISHVGITSSVFLICFASIERYCITVNNFLVPHLHKYRPLIALTAVLFGVISKGSYLFEIEVKIDEDCPGQLKYFYVSMSDWFKAHPEFNSLFRFWFRNIFTILAPFFTLLLVNFLLLNKLREQHRKSAKVSEEDDKQTLKQKKARIRAATRSIVIIVCTYLFSNALSVVITLWENINYGSLVYHDRFYTLSVDLISLLTVLASALRLPIYALCQPLLRTEMKATLGKLCNFSESPEKKKALLDSLQLPTTQLITNLDGDSPSISSKVEFV
ncbi:unnamed protein product [Caenorhabditis angaria]|uniref:G-protein coupled receptors family 1 profile domain-containing protein n=1 Tax=Caenorhabditis angaria TaxID=860376 RepID=A0A9P1IW63_9PELO|nr:unnamed protein product [Caenorhabditis angaria]